MFRSLDHPLRNGNWQASARKLRTRSVKTFAAVLTVGMTAILMGCAAPVPEPIVPPPIYAQQPYPYAYAAPAPYYYTPYATPYPYPYGYYGPCCASFSFGYWHGGGRYHHRH